MQRLGALIGLVSPRGGSFRTDYWEHSSSDLRIGSSRPGWPTLLQLIENPMETIGRYHREIFKMGVLNLDPSLPTPTEQAWTYLAEAIQDLIQAGILILRGTPVMELEASPPYAIRTENSELAVGVSFENEGPQDRHIVTLTPALFALRYVLNLNTITTMITFPSRLSSLYQSSHWAQVWLQMLRLL